MKDTQAQELGVPPISQEANEPNAAEGPTDELAVSTAIMGEPAEEQDTPLYSGRWEKRGRFQVAASQLDRGNASCMASDPSQTYPSGSG